MLEFGTTYLLLQQDGKVTKEDLRGVYDVSLIFNSTKTSYDPLRITLFTTAGAFLTDDTLKGFYLLSHS